MLLAANPWLDNVLDYMHIAEVRDIRMLSSLNATSIYCCCSGSGKSTLLDILAQRKTVGKVTGEVLIAGHKPTQTFLRRYSGYVEQFDTLLPVLTVYEMLLYTAELKQPRSVPLKVSFIA